MKRFLVFGIVAMMVLSATVAMAAVDNDWSVYIKASTDALARSGASTATFGVKTATGNNTFANLTTSPALGSYPEVNYTDATHPYTTNYGNIAGRTYVAKFAGAPLGDGSKLVTMDWTFRLVGNAGATVYMTTWNQTGTTNQIDDGTQAIQLFESDATGKKIGDAIWTYNPGVTTTWGSSTGIAGTAGTNFFQKAYTLGDADSAGGAYQYFVLEANSVSTPEPGSMLAMLSGLVGLVGFGIRRRK